MWYVKRNNNFISYLIILFSLFILVFFTRDQYNTMQENLDINNDHVVSLLQKKTELDKLNKIRSNIKEGDEKYKKYLINVDEGELIDYLYSYVEKTNWWDSTILIRDISLLEAKKNELGFLEMDINLKVGVSNELTMKRFLNFLISPHWKYNFFIDSFSYPNDGRQWSFNVNIPLKVLYK